MGKLLVNGKSYTSSADTASSINYNNSTSKLAATTVQRAIDEIAAKEVYVTQAEYDALGTAPLTNGITYHITDSGDILAAKNMPYEPSVEGGSTNVQGAIDELFAKVAALESK